jgi:hypothetical protein
MRSLGSVSRLPSIDCTAFLFPLLFARGHDTRLICKQGADTTLVLRLCVESTTPGLRPKLAAMREPQIPQSLVTGAPTLTQIGT